MIYFLQSPDGGPVKIGFSADVPAWVRDLESHYGRPLAVLATIEGGRPEEAELHARFAGLGIGRTEQFRPGADLLAFLGRPLLVDANPDAVEAMPSGREVRIRCRAEWAAWLDRLAKHHRTTVAGVMDRALAEWAKSQGYEEVPPERMP